MLPNNTLDQKISPKIETNDTNTQMSQQSPLLSRTVTIPSTSNEVVFETQERSIDEPEL
jgi:hypothetical protein